MHVEILACSYQMSARGLLAINSKNTPARITVTSMLTVTVCITNDFILFLAPVDVICEQQLSYLVAARNYFGPQKLWVDQMSHTQLYLVEILAT